MIRYENVGFSPAGQPVLKGFGLEVGRGEKVIIYGKSGTGKSTVLKMLLGFVRPETGAVFFDGREVDRKTVWEVRRRVAYVSQDLDISDDKAGDFLEWAFSIKANQACGRSREKMRVAMDWLELDRDLLDKEMADLSGGEKQRLALALAVTLGRDIFLLDEVTSAVDPEMKARIVGYFSTLEAATVLAVSHDETWLRVDGMRVVKLGD